MPAHGSDRWIAADLDKLPDDGQRYEVLNGRLVVDAAPKPRHQWLIRWLGRALDNARPPDMFVIEGVGVLVDDDQPFMERGDHRLTVTKGPRRISAGA